MELANPSLGSLDRIPAEVRAIVWEHYFSYFFASKKVPKSGQDTHLISDTNLALFRTSRQLYLETTAKYYNRESLFIRVATRCNLSAPWLEVISERGVRKKVANPKDASSGPISHLPFNKLKRIIIEIEAPRRHERDDIISIWHKVTDVVRLLEPHVLQMLSIRLKNSTHLKRRSRKANNEVASTETRGSEGDLEMVPRGTWFSDGSAQQSLLRDYKDYHIALLQFRRIHNVIDAHVHSLGEFDDTTYLRELKESLISKETPEDKRSSEQRQRDMQEIYTIFTRLEGALDIIGGPAASCLRLYRCMYWYRDVDEYNKNEPLESAYMSRLKEMGYMEYMKSNVTGSSVETDAVLAWRYALVHACNPESKRWRAMRAGALVGYFDGYETDNETDFREGYRGDEWERQYEYSIKLETQGRDIWAEYGGLREGWNEKEWRYFYWRGGIPNFRTGSETAQKFVEVMAPEEYDRFLSLLETKDESEDREGEEVSNDLDHMPFREE